MSNGDGAPAGKKGMSNWAWIGIGCAAILVIMMIVIGGAIWWGVSKAQQVAADFEANPGLAAARMIIKATPDFEEVAVDEDAGTITIRNTETGEEITVSFEDIQEGKITFSTDDQTVTFNATEDEDGDGTLKITSEDGSLTFSTGERIKGERPEWVPLYPGCEPSSRHLVTTDDGVSGALELSTGDTVEQVAEFYRQALSEAGFETGVNTFTTDEQTTAMVTGTDEAGGRTVIVTATNEGDETTVGVNYNLKR